MPLSNTRVLLADRPVNRPVRESDFKIETATLTEPKDGEVLLRTLWLSLDPYMRGRMSAARSYAKPVELGEVMTGETVSEVVTSRAPQFKSGDKVLARAGWQEQAVLPASEIERIDPEGMPLSYFLGVLGMPGQTAYCALLGVGQPKPGDTVLISAASGAVGQVAGQIAKIKGCRVIGTAGAADKIAYVKETLGLDAAIDYKGKDRDALGAELAELAPKGIDVFFDNVGGAVHDHPLEPPALGQARAHGGIPGLGLASPDRAIPPRGLAVAARGQDPIQRGRGRWHRRGAARLHRAARGRESRQAVGARGRARDLSPGTAGRHGDLRCPADA